MLRGMTEPRELEKDSGSGAAEPQSETSDRPKRRVPPPNPLYHPLFLPVLLVAFSLWFGYDGFLTRDPDMLKHQTFNRIMFGIMLPICVWIVPRGVKEFRADQAQDQATNRHSNGKPG